MGDCLGRDRMVVGFTTTYAISAYHNQSIKQSINQLINQSKPKQDIQNLQSVTYG